MGPLLAAAGISAAGSVLGGLLGSSATKKAAKLQAESAAAGLAAQREGADKVLGLNAPGVELYGQATNALSRRAGLGADDGPPALGGAYGDTANPTLSLPTLATPNAPNALDTSISAFQESPGFQFSLDRGLGAIDSSNAHRGAFNSGAAAKGLAGFATGLANQEYGDWRDYTAGRFDKDRAQFNTDRSVATDRYETDRNFATDRYDTDRDYLTNRYDQQTQDLGSLVNTGQNALTASSNAYAGIGRAGADAATATGNAYAGNALQQGNIWGGVVNNLAGTAAGLVNANGLKRTAASTIANNPLLF